MNDNNSKNNKEIDNGVWVCDFLEGRAHKSSLWWGRSSFIVILACSLQGQTSLDTYQCQNRD